ncbi:MAG: ABC transporter ATP-binding protein, partial [Gammaproteobacteria bacterium]|nr:ABC transporter ATP-binding protein [Gammaproteobacteria bacterium]
MTDQRQQSTDVKIENLNLSFGDTHVLRGVNLDIHAGEFFAFL